MKVSADLNTGAAFTGPVNVYFVIDYDHALYGELVFGRINAGKHFERVAVEPTRFGQTTLPKGHTAHFFAAGDSDNNGPSLFKFFAQLFHGTDRELLIRKNPSEVKAAFPQILKGVSATGSNNPSGGAFSEVHFAMTFQSSRTIKANNANQNVESVFDDLQVELTAKGFTPLL